MEKSAEHQQLLQGENKIRMFTPVQEETMCAGWTWYLANDFQFFLLSPVSFHFHILTLHWNHSSSLRCSLCWQPSWSRLLLPFSVPPFQPPGLQRFEYKYIGGGGVDIVHTGEWEMLTNLLDSLMPRCMWLITLVGFSGLLRLTSTTTSLGVELGPTLLGSALAGSLLPSGFNEL